MARTRYPTFAEVLGVDYFDAPTADPTPEQAERDALLDLTGPEFARAVLNSREFREYVVNMLRLGEMPSGVLVRLMDYGWGRPAEHVVHAGDAANPIVTEVRRVIVHVNAESEYAEQPTPKEIFH